MAVNGNITNPSPFAQKTAERKEEKVENSPVVTAELLLSPEVCSGKRATPSMNRRR